MIIAGIDTETTGHHDDAEIVEVGYCVYDTESKTEIAAGSDLFNPKLWDERAQEASEIHHITREMASIAGMVPEDIDLAKRILVYKPSIIIAHNAEYDYPKIKRHWPKLCENVPWLCTLKDLDHSKFVKASTRRLMYLAVEYGIPVVGWHRAGGDARTTCQIASQHDLAQALVLKSKPRFRIMTIGPYSDVAKAQLPKIGFHWQSEPNRCYISENVPQIDVPMLKKKVKEIVPASWGIVEEQMPPRSY